MKRFAIAVLLSLQIAAFAAGECRLTSNAIADGVDEYVLSNGVITVKCVPELSGLISGFASLDEGREMIEAVNCTVRQDDLLPWRCQASLTGLRELVRGVKVNIYTRYRPQGQTCTEECAELVLAGRGFYRWNINAVKRIVLRQGESRVRVTLTLTAAEDIGQPLLLWFNGIAQMGQGRDTVLLPVCNTVESRADRKMGTFTGNGIFADWTVPPQDIFAAPLAPWIARFSPGRAGVLALRLDNRLIDGGVLVSWKHMTLPLHTAEVIFPPVRLKKGETWESVSDFIYFPKLPSLRAVVGTYGLDWDGRELLVASAVPAPPGKLTLRWRDKNGNEGALGECDLPALAPGKLARFPIQGEALSDDCALLGVLPGNQPFELPGMVRLVAQ